MFQLLLEVTTVVAIVAGGPWLYVSHIEPLRKAASA